MSIVIVSRRAISTTGTYRMRSQNGMRSDTPLPFK
jgi:hypothetical protein